VAPQEFFLFQNLLMEIDKRTERRKKHERCGHHQEFAYENREYRNIHGISAVFVDSGGHKSVFRIIINAYPERRSHLRDTPYHPKQADTAHPDAGRAKPGNMDHIPVEGQLDLYDQVTHDCVEVKDVTQIERILAFV
jgi:hypothetical protein